MSLDEFSFIATLMRPLARSFPGALDLADDAALIPGFGDCDYAIASDALVAGVHMFPDDPPASVAHKLLAVNCSDLAAMGASPFAYLITLKRPRDLADDWLAGFARGLAEAQERFGLTLIGGDTVSGPEPLVLSATVLGRVPRGRALLRKGAVPGDDLWVSGTLGEAAIGLRILRGLALPEEDALGFIGRYRHPQPRIALGRRLIGVASAAIDISDGLVADLQHLARASKVAAVVEAERLPLSEAARGVPGARESALFGGDDYELLFTADPAHRSRITALGEELGLALSRIGSIEAGEGVRVVDEEGRDIPLDRPGWRHF